MAVSGATRFGVVGLGAMGRTHLALLRALGTSHPVEVVAVADIDEFAVAQALSGPQCRGFTDPAALVHDGGVDAVVVATSDAAHAAVVHACLDRGVPVLCEKPLTTSVEDSAAIVEREWSIGRRLVQVGFMRRYDPDFARVAETVHRGALGQVAVVRTVHRNPVQAYAFEPSVLVTNSASHDVDLVRWTTQDEVVEVECEQSAHAGPDFATVLMRTRTRGGVSTLSELMYGPDCGYVVGLEAVGPDGVASTAMQRTESWTGRFEDAYRLQMASWVSAVVGGIADPVGASARDGLAVTCVLEAAERALRTGRTEQVETGFSQPPPRRPAR